jgi:dihydrodipicolinate synthase/N-acetylneuraminate lyase
MIPVPSSVIAVPPLARDAHLKAAASPNRRIMAHIAAGGIRIFLYGGNAVFYHIRPSEYAGILAMLAENAPAATDIIPSAGPSYGLSMDQAAILRDFPFPTAMVLPHQGLNTPDGVATGIRHFAEAYGKPIVVYLKAEGYLTPALTASLVRDGLVSWIKYAIVRADEHDDPFLSDLLAMVDPSIVVSGMGGFTTGCGCLHPALSTRMLTACHEKDWQTAEIVRASFQPLEDLRNAINPVRVLHEAVSLAGIAPTGPLPPLLSGLTETEREAVAEAATDLVSSGH